MVVKKQIAWPDSKLGCLSETSKDIVNNVLCNVVQTEEVFLI